MPIYWFTFLLHQPYLEEIFRYDYKQGNQKKKNISRRGLVFNLREIEYIYRVKTLLLFGIMNCKEPVCFKRRLTVNTGFLIYFYYWCPILFHCGRITLLLKNLIELPARHEVLKFVVEVQRAFELRRCPLPTTTQQYICFFLSMYTKSFHTGTTLVNKVKVPLQSMQHLL